LDSDSSKGMPLLVPDTNALLYNTDIDKWNFAEASKFRIMLTPTVLSELDQLKVAGRTDEVRKKSEKLIRQIKEYRRRGPLANGASVKKDAVELASIAIEPDTEAMLPWLRTSFGRSQPAPGAAEGEWESVGPG